MGDPPSVVDRLESETRNWLERDLSTWFRGTDSENHEHLYPEHR